MNICVLSDPTFEDFSPATFFKDYEWEMFCVERPAYEFIVDISCRKHFDVYFNLCDGALDEDRPGLDVVQALEALNLPFTGADSRFYCPTREQMQSVAEIQGVGFVRGFHIKSLRDLSEAKKFRYPLMVKHPNSYGSAGMTRDSRVETPQQLRIQAERMLDLFGGARVEEFIEGPEFTCLVADNPEDLGSPFVYPPGMVVFPKGETFLHTETKWLELARIKRVKDGALASRIQDMSKKLFIGLGGMGYGRTDIRMNAEGELFILEINPNCAILYRPEDQGPADVPITFDPDGHRGFFDRIFRSAVLRHQLRVPLETKKKARVSVRILSAASR
jgi:D-alanine-D-alanine ligase-like ATP-grasp enzyme